MHSAAVRVNMTIGQGQVLGLRPAPKAPAARFLRLAHLRRLKECEKVAAVCYRIRPSGIQFLLVQTKRGRWTFPKGSVEPGLTHAQSAALEAFEEAGVHGRMEEATFTRYVHQKGCNSSFPEIEVSAHLCEVSRLEPPPEPGRNRTWFPIEKAKERLREGRKLDDGAELARVVDRAVARVLRQQQSLANSQDGTLRNVVVIEGTRSRRRSYITPEA
ncbi:MAG TPA: NUDIX domain-containing protein [Terriglobales bacterium]|nr:NUDIX domain-containing protein [Terriglobales bacterium]